MRLLKTNEDISDQKSFASECLSFWKTQWVFNLLSQTLKYYILRLPKEVYLKIDAESYMVGLKPLVA